MIALDLDQAQADLGVLGEQGTHQRRLASATRAPEQGMVGRHAADELTSVARQLLALGVHTQQVAQRQVEADIQRQQVAAAAITHPARRHALAPVHLRTQCRQQGFDALKHLLGAGKKIQ